MIAALLAAPLVEGVVGQVINQFVPARVSPRFTPYIQNLTTAAPQAPLTSAPFGTLRASQWNQMTAASAQTWLKGLSGRQVDATDMSGRLISGVVGEIQNLGGTTALNIGGHLVSLSQLKQVSWSPAAYSSKS